MFKFFRYLISFYRRGRYGWDYSDTFDMDSYLSRIIPEMLRYLATTGTCPHEFYNEETGDNKKWEAKLIEIAEGFEKYELYDLEYNYDYSGREYKELRKGRDKSLKLLAKYFDYLWS